ncbi:MAG: type II toxin-antitoxin system HicA family toxin [Xenococcaceae cyanobacterium MO_188.B32]|nr:type II toxin-antitoxin system HicA family toxin [Xenococcaceae cyanobacterium MO_188.B32]
MIRQLEKLGWQVVQNDRNYIIMSNYSKPATLFIPNSNEINKEILKTLIDESGLTVKEFFSVS